MADNDLGVNYSRLRRNSQVFEDDILNYEREHSDEIKKYQEVVSTLKAEIIQVAERNTHLQDLLQKTKENLEELTALNNNLRVSCEVLEKENDMAARETKRLRGEVFHLKSCREVHAEQMNAGSQNAKEKGDVVTPPKNNIFILGDGLAKGFRDIVERCMGKEYHVSALIKENALLDDVVKEVFNYTRHFDKKDYVILMAGVTNLVKGRHIEEKTIQTIKSVGKYTNVIICSVPLWKNNTLVNNFINEYNKMMSNRLCNGDMSNCFLHFNAFIGNKDIYFNYNNNNLYIKYRGKLHSYHHVKVFQYEVRALATVIGSAIMIIV
ncbi:unnamed protein product [Ceutorhynchus assimilis]|uniref:Uncharacterized protein n=1 Tax=Ceutorhynchus assimilis TaxID=467358 RepID=A0A9N9MYG4_9CUCU|nr:unnamed protein product [Ceutorhynchus assimilis]